MAGPWSLDQLASVAGKPKDGLRRYADVGLLHRKPDGDFEPDSLHRLRLIQFARGRGVSDEQLAAATASQGDILSIFEEFDPASEIATSMFQVAQELGLDDAVIGELAVLLDWDDPGTATEADVAALRVLATALELGMPRDALLQIVRVFADATDRLADAIVRTFHNNVHERFRAQGLAGGELLEATDNLGKPLLNLVEPGLVYFHRRGLSACQSRGHAAPFG